MGYVIIENLKYSQLISYTHRSIVPNTFCNLRAVKNWIVINSLKLKFHLIVAVLLFLCARKIWINALQWLYCFVSDGLKNPWIKLGQLGLESVIIFPCYGIYFVSGCGFTQRLPALNLFFPEHSSSMHTQAAEHFSTFVLKNSCKNLIILTFFHS